MTDIHILTGNNAGSITIAMHVPVPDVNNDVGVNYRVALVNSGIGLDNTTGRRTVLPSGIGPGQINVAEEALIDAGEVFEFLVPTSVPPGASNAELIVIVQNQYASTNSNLQQQIGERLRYFGHTMSAA